MIQAHQLKVSRTARYYTIGEASPSVRYCCIACHGYAQLAGHFIRRFDAVAREDTLIIAPEGLSRFYWRGLSGQVAASWMTKEARLEEIADYSAYLTQLYEQFLPQLAPDAQLMLLGFSQGCATQVRWLMRDRPAFHRLVLWAGLLPEDIDYTPAQAYLSSKDFHFVYGEEDPFLTEARLSELRQQFADLDLPVQEQRFTGQHELSRDALKELFATWRI